MGTKRTKASCGTNALDSVDRKKTCIPVSPISLSRKKAKIVLHLTTGNKFYVIASGKKLMWQGLFLNNLLV